MSTNSDSDEWQLWLRPAPSTPGAETPKSENLGKETQKMRKSAKKVRPSPSSQNTIINAKSIPLNERRFCSAFSRAAPSAPFETRNKARSETSAKPAPR